MRETTFKPPSQYQRIREYKFQARPPSVSGFLSSNLTKRERSVEVPNHVVARRSRRDALHGSSAIDGSAGLSTTLSVSRWNPRTWFMGPDVLRHVSRRVDNEAQ